MATTTSARSQVRCRSEMFVEARRPLAVSDRLPADQRPRLYEISSQVLPVASKGSGSASSPPGAFWW